MKASVWIVPLILLCLFAYAIVRRVRVYDAFTSGVGQALPLAFSLFPYLAAMFIMTHLFEASGLSALLLRLLAPVLRLMGIPQELGSLLLIKPFSGSGALATLSEIIETHGADSLIARQACVLYGSSETVFYVAAVYFAGLKNKRLFMPIAISLAAGLIGSVVGCALCRVL